MNNIFLADKINSINDVISYIRNCELLISVDTSLIHIAYGLHKDIVAIYAKTDYFNIWLPPKKNNIEFVFSHADIINGAKNMNVFDGFEIDLSINRIKNANRLSEKRVVFFYWHAAFIDMPLSHRNNIENIKRRLINTSWEVIVTNLERTSENYIENYIELPDYFYSIKDKIKDQESLHGNHSDIIRLRLLEKFGGVYFDTSTIFLRDSMEEILLYNDLMNSETATLAGYTNITFTRKNKDGSNYFENAKDGIELSLLYAKKASPILKVFNKEIDRYWNWKNIEKNYNSYPLFINANLQEISFLNEYHIHYTIYHLIITIYPSLIDQVIVQSVHMKGKETSTKHGPYAISDMFCRGRSTYESASPDKLFECFTDNDIKMFNGKITSLEERIEIFKDIELIKIPGYMRSRLEKEFTNIESYSDKESVYKLFYKVIDN